MLVNKVDLLIQVLTFKLPAVSHSLLNSPQLQVKALSSQKQKLAEVLCGLAGLIKFLSLSSYSFQSTNHFFPCSLEIWLWGHRVEIKNL